MSKSLDLGCGEQPRNPFHADEVYGVDVRDGLGGRIRRADLVVDPIPFADGSFDYVTAHDFIEHLPRILYAPERRHPFVELMNEVYRVLKPGGLFFSFTPAYPHVEAFRDPTHVNIITFDTFPLYFADPEPYGVIYGFEGAFEIGLNEWRGKHVASVLRKIESPRRPERAAPPGTRVSAALAGAGEGLGATLDSLLAQTHADMEIVALDPRVLEAFAARPADPRIRRAGAALRRAPVPQALNIALSTMNGDYLVIAHAGERYPPDWLERRIHAVRKERADAAIACLPADAGRSAALAGRAACERLGVDAALDHALDHALWDMELVRAIGFEEFATDAHRYAARRFLLACRRVALVPSEEEAAVHDAAPAPSADAPYTELRLMQLYEEQGLPRRHVRAQKARALASLARSQQPAAHGVAFDAAAARHTIDRFVARLSLVHVFDRRPRPTPRERLRKLKHALRQRAERIGLAFEHR